MSTQQSAAPTPTLDGPAAPHPYGERFTRRLCGALVVLSVVLVVWMFMMGSAPQGRAEVRNWSSSWIGLDVLEFLGLLGTTWLLWHRSPHLPAVAGASAALFGIDAWFDVMTALSGSDWYTAVTFAAIAELPLAVLLGYLAATAPRRLAERGGSEVS
ncbi:hypothetical protein [Kitasatospora kifunensis]|uniref:Uncharacterized protein n=1 Tax=Kitasatospora kifunensis TaxID=58351 RepID=A0A7W7R6M2_KITKI|nr:hypothetical protein [Kitasatospora kifunensis]MBB4926387.1 hypothetical protein [Kitasatospora kifunensis]